MAQGNKVASWYWIVSAVLTPAVMISCLIWAYYAQEVQSYRAEGTRLVATLETNHAQLAPLLSHMKDTASATGWGMSADPKKESASMVGKVQTPKLFQNSEERALPQDKRSPLLTAYMDAESRFYGSSETAGYIHEYAAAREWLGKFETELQRYVAFKTYQYYTVDTINVGGTNVTTAGGDLSRDVTKPSDVSISVATDTALENAWTNQADGKLPPDRVMQPPITVTLEYVFRKQMQLLSDLVSANLHQYSLLIADVSGKITVLDENDNPVAQVVGYEGEDDLLAAVLADLVSLTTKVEDRKAESQRILTDGTEGVAFVTNNMKNDVEAKDNRFQIMVVAGNGRIELLQSSFATEKLTHESDAQEFKNLIRNLPRLKEPKKLEKTDPDGEISYSDYTRGMTHIDLGYSDGVRVGQRFEVWRRHGFEKDEFVGVVEIIRMLSAHYSLCTVLSLSDDDDPVRKGDQIMSKIWHDGEFLTIALHGSYVPPNEAYSKERLTALLEQLGVKVAAKVQPGTDLVVLGSNLLGDEWYRNSRDVLRFETLKEDDIRLYIDPR